MSNLESEPKQGLGQPVSPGRRRFLTILSVAFGTLSAAMMAVPSLAYFVAPLFRKRNSAWRSVGRVEKFKTGETVAVSFDNVDTLPWDGELARTAAWLRRESDDKFIAFAINCTHLGCPVRWKADANLFLCPCHGGVFYSDGTVAGGPPPRPLVRYKVRVHEGQVEIETEPIPIA